MSGRFDWQPQQAENREAVKLTEMQEKVFIDRYALRGTENELLENRPEEMWERVSKVIAAAEETPEKRAEWQAKFYDALHDFNFVPAGRILKGAGANASLTFYNCFVIPSPEDSRAGIFDNVKLMIEVLSRGGGVGVNLSSLRPRGSYVKGVNGTASGAVSFGGLYSYATGLIEQGGSRRGALMLMLNDDHPDIEEFITVKREMGLVTNANLSVCVSDRLMKAVEENGDWELKWGGKVHKTIKARELWDLICESAWESGEPGVIFMERYNKVSNTWYFEDIISVNPCGEQGLPEWGVCNLGAVNVYKMVQSDGTFNFDRLKEVVHSAVRFLDNVVDSTDYHFEENERAQRIVRRTGLGTMGLGDTLIKMKLRYGSDEAKQFTEKLYAFIRDEAYRASVENAKEKGPFPQFVKEKYLQGEFIKQLPADIQKSIGDYGIRNGVILTQAPTGTTSLLAGTSSGIEPVYDFAFKRKDNIGEHYIYHHLYEDYILKNGKENVPDYFVTAKELSPEDHVEMQAIIQKYTDSSISKTVNAPNSHTVDDVQNLYMKAYKLGCKGIAYYRDGSRDKAVLESVNKEQVVKEKKEQVGQQALPDIAGKFDDTMGQRIVPRERPEMVQGTTYKTPTIFGDMFVTINSDDHGIVEVLAQLSRSADPLNNYTQVLSRLISLSLSFGIEPHEVRKAITGSGGTFSNYLQTKAMPSCPDALAEVIDRHLEAGDSQTDAIYAKNSVGAAVLSSAVQDNAAHKKSVLNQAMQGVVDLTKGGDAVVDSTEDEEEMMTTSTPTLEKAAAPVVGLKETNEKPMQVQAPTCPTCKTELELAEGCMKCHGCGYGLCGM